MTKSEIRKSMTTKLETEVFIKNFQSIVQQQLKWFVHIINNGMEENHNEMASTMVLEMT